MRRLSKSEPISDGTVFVFQLAYLMRKSGFESLKWYIFFQHEKRNFVSPSDPVMFYLLHKKPMKYQTILLKQFFGLKGVDHMWRYQVFARKLTWYFIGVYIINIYI